MTFEGKTHALSVIYQTLVERETVGACFSRMYLDWHMADVNYRSTDLLKTWLEDENGNMIKGSLENVARRRASTVSSDKYLNRGDAAQDCEQKRDKLKIESYSAAEAKQIISQFLKGPTAAPAKN